MQCQKCNTINDPDSKFCKNCGQYFISQTQQSARKPDDNIRVGELIYAAYKYKESGQIDDAILACQGALTLNEASISAHSILASLYELKGDIDSALLEYNQVLKLDPSNSSIQKKIEDLQYALLAPIEQSPGIFSKVEFLRPYLPAIAAAVSLIVVLSFCYLLLHKQSNAAEGIKNENTQTAVQPQMTTPVQPYQQQYQQNPIYQQPQTYPNQDQIQNPQVPQPQTAPAPAVAQSPDPNRSQGSTNKSVKRGIPSVPLPRFNQPAAVTPLPPVNVQPVTQHNNESPVIVPVDGNDQGFSNSEKSSQPAIQYQAPTVTKSSNSPIQPVQDPEQKALRLQGSGNYQDAISVYKDNINKSSDKGRAYQQMALSYQRLGQHRQAIDSYNKAIQSYKEQLAAGRDPASVQRDIRSCEAGIQVSQSQAK